MSGLLTRVLASLLRHSAGLLGPGRRGWVEAVLAEAGEIPAGSARVAWLRGGLWLVAREVLMHRGVRVLAFLAAAGGVVWIAWPGSASDSAVAVNRIQVPLILVLLAGLPLVVRRYCGPVRDSWWPRSVRVGGYAVVLALIAGKAVIARDGSKLGAYFHQNWDLETVLVLAIASYVAGILILTSQRVRLTRSSLPIGIGVGAVWATVLYASAPLGADLEAPSLKWWWLAALALPLATGFVVAGLSARDARATVLAPTHQGCLTAICCSGTAALLLGALTSVTIALFPQHVPLQTPPPPAHGGCETCDPNSVVIPPDLRHEYWVEISVGQADLTAYFVLLIAPFFGAALGALGAVGAGLASRSPGTSGRGDGGPPPASAPALSPSLAREPAAPWPGADP